MSCTRCEELEQKLAELQEKFDKLANSAAVVSRAEVLGYTPTRELTDVEAEVSGLCRVCHTKRECKTVEAKYRKQFSTKDHLRIPVLLCEECIDKVGYGPSGVKP